MDFPAVVIDNGTGFTKMGFAGNMEPSFQIPTALSDTGKKVNINTNEIAKTVQDKSEYYYIGDEAFNPANAETHKPHYLLRGGMI